LIYLEPLALAMSKKSGRPVKMVMSREEVFRGTGPAAGAVIEVRLGAKKDGRLTAAEAVLKYQAGAFPGSPVGPGCMCAFAMYDIPNAKVTGYDVVSNRPKVAAYRAPGAPNSSYGVESCLDELADQLGIDPLVLREKNAAKDGVKALHGPTWQNIGYAATVEAAKNHPHLKEPLGPNQGRGVASGFWFNIGGESSAACHINEDGTAVVAVGTPDNGQAGPAGANAGSFEPLPLAEIALKSGRTGGPISAEVSVNAQGAGPGFATHICDVEVDKETGYVKILRYTAVQDVGRAIHPSYVEGQIQGGVTQGIGWALNEEYIYDKDGRLENPGFLDYRVPVAPDVPMIDTVMVENANPRHPFGARGVGEVPIVPPMAAVANAINDAIGVRMRDLPMSPPRLRAAIDAQQPMRRAAAE